MKHTSKYTILVSNVKVNMKQVCKFIKVNYA